MEISRIRDGKKSDPVFGMEKSQIRDEHPGSVSAKRPIETQRDPWGQVFLQRLISPSVDTNLFVVRSSVSFKVHNGRMILYFWRT